MLKGVKLTLMAVWLSLCVVSLVFCALHISEPPADDDLYRHIQLGLQMAALTFPLGYALGMAALFLREVGGWLGLGSAAYTMLFGHYGFVILWLIMTVAGYFQWFVWLPKCVPVFLRWFRNNQTVSWRMIWANSILAVVFPVYFGVLFLIVVLLSEVPSSDVLSTWGARIFFVLGFIILLTGSFLNYRLLPNDFSFNRKLIISAVSFEIQIFVAVLGLLLVGLGLDYIWDILF